MKKKLLIVSVLCVSLALPLAVLSSRNHVGISHGVDECSVGNHDGNHYLAHAPTSDEAGNEEFWACCVCHRQYLSNPGGTFVDAGEYDGPELEQSHVAYVAPLGHLYADLVHQYFVDTQLEMPAAKVQIGNNLINMTGTFVGPDGVDIPGSKITLDTKGTYSIRYVGTYGSVAIEKVAQFDVVDDVDFISSPNPSVVQSITPATTDGLKFNLAKGDKLYFNEKFNMSSAAFAGAWTLFTPGLVILADAEFELVMRDTVDPSNFVSIKIVTYSNTNWMSYWIKASGQDYGDGYTAAQGSPKTNIIVDYATKQFRLGKDDGSVNNDASLAAVWNGFTNGDFYMTFECIEAEGTVSCLGDYVCDNRNYAVTRPAVPSSRNGINFSLKQNSEYVLEGYKTTLPANDCAYFLFQVNFVQLYINATVWIKVYDASDADNYIYIIIETLSNGAIRFSTSTSTAVNASNLIGTNSVSGTNALNIIWNGASQNVTTNNTPSGAVTNDISWFSATDVRATFVSDMDVDFSLGYFGDSNSWLTSKQG